jgi:OmpA-OmpF porin, OOP family
MRSRSLLLVPAVLLALQGTAAAQQQTPTTGFALDQFNPSERGSEWFVLDTLDLRGNWRPALGVVGEYAYRPLVIYNPDGSIRVVPVSDQFALHLGGSLVFKERLRVGFDLPLFLGQGGDSGSVNGFGVVRPTGPGVGDLRLGADLRLVGEYGGPFTAALGFQLFVPTGKASLYDGDGEVRALPRLSAAGDLGMFVYGATVGVLAKAAGGDFAGNPNGSQLVLGASAGLRLIDKKLVVGPELYGATAFNGFFDKESSPLEGLLGAHYSLEPFRLGAAVGPGLSRGYGSPAARVVGSIEWAPGIPPPPPIPPPDRDHDGILDWDDACPDVPGVLTGDPATNGCPDRDHDGIVDSLDACPDDPGPRTDDPKTNGCPDRDHDGIIDKFDACPDVPGIRTDDPKTNGCPDRDGDGIVDSLDACPDVKGIRTDDPKTNGCPPDLDRDKDGIPNDQDACPDEPGPRDPDPKRNGCPKAFVRGTEIKILDQVKFKTGSSQIVKGKESEDILDAVADILKKHPEIKKIRVEGHTDNVGKAKDNKKLSSDRAGSVVKWLTTHGIPKTSLSSVGFGQERPIDTNDTEVGRHNNRRVEFHIEDSPAKAH